MQSRSLPILKIAEFKIFELSPDGRTGQNGVQQSNEPLKPTDCRNTSQEPQCTQFSNFNHTTKWILALNLPDSILGSIFHLTMAHEQWQYLRNQFGEPTQPYKTVCTATEAVHECREVKKELGWPEVDIRGASKRKCQ